MIKTRQSILKLEMGGYHMQLHLCFFPEKKVKFKRPKRPRFSLECIVDSPEEKQTLTTRLDNLRKRLSMDNKAILYAMFDAVCGGESCKPVRGIAD